MKQKGSPRSPCEAGFAVEAGFAPILIVILIAALVGSYLLYQNQSKPTSPSRLFTQPTITPSPSPTSTPESTNSAETANWKTYTNTKYNYTLKYPSTSNLNAGSKINPEMPDLLDGTVIDIHSDPNPRGFNLIRVWSNLGIKIIDKITRDEWCNRLTEKELKDTPMDSFCVQHDDNFQETLVSGQKALRLASSGNKKESFYIPYKNYVYEITLFNTKYTKVNGVIQEVDDPMPHQILSTFRFD